MAKINFNDLISRDISPETPEWFRIFLIPFNDLLRRLNTAFSQAKSYEVISVTPSSLPFYIATKLAVSGAIIIDSDPFTSGSQVKIEKAANGANILGIENFKIGTRYKLLILGD